MSAKRVIVLTLISTPLLSTIAGIACWIARPGLPEGAPMLLATSLALLIQYTGASVLFWMGLRNFTPRLRQAYGLFCAGMLAFAIAGAQVPVGVFLGLGQTIWISGGLLVIPILGAQVVMLVGVRRLARLFDAHTIWSRGWLITLAAITVGVVAPFLPLGPHEGTIQEAQAVMVLVGINAVTAFATSMMAYRIRQVTAATAYASATNWFFIALAGLFGMVMHVLFMNMTFGTAHWWMMYGAYNIVNVIATMPFLKAAYDFNRLEHAPAPVQTSAPVATVLDIVMAAATKVSNPRAIEHELDQVRGITSRMAAGETLTAEDQVALAGVYRAIEDYLANQEPVRRYTPDQLWQRLQQELNMNETAMRKWMAR